MFYIKSAKDRTTYCVNIDKTLYIKTIVGSYFYLFFQSLRRVLRARRSLVLDLDDSQKRGFARQDEYRCAHSGPNPLGGKSDAKPPHATFTNNMYAST